MKLHTITGWLALVLAMAGCKINSDYGNTRYRCDMSGQCPDGFACMNGYCETGDATPDGGVSARACGVLEMAVEDFAAPDVDGLNWTTWVDDPATSMTHVDGQLAFDIPAGVEYASSGYAARNWYRFTDSRAFVEVVDAQPDSNIYLSLNVAPPDSNDADNRWFMEQQAGILSFFERVEDSTTQLGNISYDPVAHRWWQIREQDGVVYWETSPDATSWTTHAMKPSTLTDRPVTMFIETWVSDPEPVPRTFVVDNVNGGVDPGIAWCPAATLSDDFDDGVRSFAWNFWDDQDCLLREEGGQLAFEFIDTAYGDCGYYTYFKFDLSDSEFVVEGPSADVGEMHIAFTAWFDDENSIEMWHGHGELVGSRKVQGNGDQMFSIPFDPVQHHWWRLRGEGGTVFWESSADGTAWTTHSSHSSPPLPLDRAELLLWGFVDESVVARDNIGNGFDNVNLAPAP